MVYLFLADGFEEIEALTPADMLKRAGINVTTVSINKSKEVIGAHGITVLADVTASEVSAEDIDMVILPGGLPGADNLRHNLTVQKFIDAALENKAYLAAICAAPRILGERNILNGKRVTCYPGFEKYLEGALCSGEGCVADGKIITAKGMGRAVEFSLKLIEVLTDPETAEKIGDSVFA